MTDSIRKRLLSLLEQRILFLDGAMGSLLQQHALTERDFRGERFKDHPCDLKGCNDLLCLTQPAIIEQIHLDYLAAGANIIETNSFNANPTSLDEYQLGYLTREINRASAQIARQSIASLPKDQQPDRFVAGILGPTTRSLLTPCSASDPALRNITFDELVAGYTESVTGLIEGGADLIMIETIFDPLNAKAAIFAILEHEKTTGLDIPIIISGTIPDRSGRLLGQTPEAFWNAVSHAKPISIGLNCAMGAAQLKPFLAQLAAVADCYINCHPNAGMPNALGGYDQRPEEMAALIEDYAHSNLINIVGGCCGTTPDFIRAMVQRVRHLPPRHRPTVPMETRLSGLEPLTINAQSMFIQVGERTNVTGSARFKKQIIAKDYAGAVEVAREQVNNGAQIIDINMDESLLDSAAEMTHFLNLIAAEPDINRVPIMIDSSRFEVLEAGLKCLQGKGVVNSISLKEGPEKFLAQARLIHQYGAAMIVMAFDEAGQAETYERKVEICTRAYHLLTREAGIPPNDIIFDPNIFAIATGIEEHARYGVDFINATRTLRETLPHVLVSGGISNVSFSFRGNPGIREAIHAVFLYHATCAGLSMGIVNAGQISVFSEVPQALRDAIEAVLLNGSVADSEHLIELASHMTLDPATQTTPTGLPQWREATVSTRLAQALVRGIGDYINTDIDEALSQFDDPLGIIDGPLMDGIQQVGELFGEGKLFLPQVIKSARVMKTAVARLMPTILARKPDQSITQGKVLLATVRGDVHDIGKNIVAVVLQCNNYEVIDAGVMTPCERILELAREHQPDIIGLSGLITPSLDEMCTVAAELEKNGFDIPLLIGGATTSLLHTALKIDPLYHAPCVHINDASGCVGAINRLLNPATREAFTATLKRQMDEVRARHVRTANPSAAAGTKGLSSEAMSAPNVATHPAARRVSLIEARQNRERIDWAAEPPCQPKKWGLVDLNEVVIEQLIPLIDWQWFFREWGIRGKYPALLVDPETGPIAEQLIRDTQLLLQQAVKENRLPLRGVLGVFPANSSTDDVVIYTDDTRAQERLILCFLRQQFRKNSHQPHVCLSDFIAPHSSGLPDFIGAFAVSAGFGVEAWRQEFIENNDEYGAILLKLVANRLTVAYAEYAHRLAMRDLFGTAPMLDLSDPAPVAGICPAPGYPAYPDHSEKIALWSLLEVQERTGISLTETLMMQPAASACALIMPHPRAHYFGVGRPGEDQLTDYARRKGIDPQFAAQYLAFQNLQ